MLVKEYLSKAYRINKKISSKIEQVMVLRELATKTTYTLSDMLLGEIKSRRRMEDIVEKIVDLEAEINRDIKRLIKFKKQIMCVIKAVKSPELQRVLQLRYLCFKPWKQIAAEMNCEIDNIFKLHNKAIKIAVIPGKLHKN